MTFRLKAAAFENSIGDADCGGRFELELLSGFIIPHQERAVNDVENEDLLYLLSFFFLPLLLGGK